MLCHSRESGNPVNRLDARLRGHDEEVAKLMLLMRSSFTSQHAGATGERLPGNLFARHRFEIQRVVRRFQGGDLVALLLPGLQQALHHRQQFHPFEFRMQRVHMQGGAMALFFVLHGAQHRFVHILFGDIVDADQFIERRQRNRAAIEKSPYA